MFILQMHPGSRFSVDENFFQFIFSQRYSRFVNPHQQQELVFLIGKIK